MPFFGLYTIYCTSTHYRVISSMYHQWNAWYGAIVVYHKSSTKHRIWGSAEHGRITVCIADILCPKAYHAQDDISCKITENIHLFCNFFQSSNVLCGISCLSRDVLMSVWYWCTSGHKTDSKCYCLFKMSFNPMILQRCSLNLPKVVDWIILLLISTFFVIELISH